MKSLRRLTTPLLLASTLVLTSSLFAGSGKLAKDLESLDPASNVDVIVQFKQAPTEPTTKAFCAWAAN